MLGEFLTWWGQQLLSLLPALDRRQGDAVIATLQSPGLLDVAVRRRGRLGALGRFALTPPGLGALRTALGARRPPVELLVGDGALLDQVVTLPLAAERDAARVLGYEMDRLTPFSAEELFWTWAVVQRDRARAQLRVRLTLVPRIQLAPVLQALAAAGFTPVALLGTAGQRIGLEPARPRRWGRRGVAALGALCVVLAGVATVLPFAQQSRQSRAVERRITELRPAVDRAEALRRGMASTATGIDVLATQRARVGDPLALLATLTDLLPDDTTLTDLTLRQRTLGISGQSAAAARLIPALAGDPAIRNPVFAAPVTRNEATRGEGFSIRAEAAP